MESAGPGPARRGIIPSRGWSARPARFGALLEPGWTSLRPRKSRTLLHPAGRAPAGRFGAPRARSRRRSRTCWPRCSGPSAARSSSSSRRRIGRASLPSSVQIYSARPERVALLPEHDALFYERSFADAPLVHQRLAALALLGDEVATAAELRIVVASVRALMHRVLPLDEFRTARRTIRPGEVVRPEELTAAWARSRVRVGRARRRAGDVQPARRDRRRLPGRLAEPGPNRVLRRRGGVPPSLRPGDAALAGLGWRGPGASGARASAERSASRQTFFGSRLRRPPRRVEGALRPRPRAAAGRRELRGARVLRALPPERERPRPPARRGPRRPRRAGAGALGGRGARRSRPRSCGRSWSSGGSCPAEFAAPYLGWPSLERRLAGQGRAPLQLAGGVEPRSRAARRVPSTRRTPTAASSSRRSTTREPRPRRARRSSSSPGRRAGSRSCSTSASSTPRPSRTCARRRAAGIARPRPRLARRGVRAGRGSTAASSSLRVLTDREIFGWSKVEPGRPAATRRAARCSSPTSRSAATSSTSSTASAATSAWSSWRPTASSATTWRSSTRRATGSTFRSTRPTASAATSGRATPQPSLSRLGTQDWVRAKARVKQAVQEMAEELLELYAARAAKRGPRLLRPTPPGRPSWRRPSPTSRRPTSSTRSTRSRPTWSRRSRWTGCSAATSATARPRSRSARPSRR